MASECLLVPNPYGDMRFMIFEALLSDALLTAEMLGGLTLRDNPASIAGLVEKAQASYDDIESRRETLVLSREETSLLQDKLDRLQAQLRFFATNPGGYEA